MKPTKEQFIATTKHHWTGSETVFNVDSVNHNYNNVIIHDTDIQEIDGVQYVSYGDISGDDAITRSHEKKEDSEIAVELEDSKEEVTFEIEKEQIEIVVDEMDLKNNPELEKEGIEVGDIITIDAEEVVKETPLKKSADNNQKSGYRK